MSVLLCAAGISVAGALSAGASVVFTASGTNSSTGQYLSASAEFEVVHHGSQLQITLSNLGAPALDESDVLTAVFFDLEGVGKLRPVSAVLNTGSMVLDAPPSSARNLGKNWEYLGGLSGIPGGPTRGISAADLGALKLGNFAANGQNLHGVDYGLVDGIGGPGNARIHDLRLESNSMVFTLGGLPASFDLGEVSNVEFEYGSSLCPIAATRFPIQVPEPSALALLALGSMALVLFRRPQQ